VIKEEDPWTIIFRKIIVVDAFELWQNKTKAIAPIKVLKTREEKQ